MEWIFSTPMENGPKYFKTGQLFLKMLLLTRRILCTRCGLSIPGANGIYSTTVLLALPLHYTVIHCARRLPPFAAPCRFSSLSSIPLASYVSSACVAPQVFRVRSVTDAPEPRTARIGIKNDPLYGSVTYPFAKMMSKIFICFYDFVFFLFFGSLVIK